MKQTVTWHILPAMLVAATFAAAQPRDPGTAPGPHPPFRQGSTDRWQDHDVREVVEMVMMVRLSKELELDDEQTVVLVRRFEALKSKWAQKRRERQGLLTGLKAAIRDGSDEAVIEQKLADLVKFDVNIEKEKLGILQEAGEGLSVTQKAKLYVFVGEFEERLRNMIRRAREHQGAGQRPKGPDVGEGQRMPFRQRDPGEEVLQGPMRGRTAPPQTQPEKGSGKERSGHRGRDGARRRGASLDANTPPGATPRDGDAATAE